MLRLTDLREWLLAHGATPITGVPHFRPSRFLAVLANFRINILNLKSLFTWNFDLLHIPKYRSGIFPDPMHNIDLAAIPDCAVSLLLDWTDGTEFVSGASRAERLKELHRIYRDFMANDPDRASPKLFSVEVLKPGASAYVSVSQHYLAAAAARSFVIFLAKLAEQFCEQSATQANLWRAGICLGLQNMQRVAMENGPLGLFECEAKST